jgi:DNA-binding transcriptional LysR family regulator
MDLDKLRALVELSRRGTMSAVARATGFGSSAVSGQLAALEKQVGVRVIEPVGRGVRLTPEGRRLAHRGESILAAVTAAEIEISGGAAPEGLVRVAGYTTALQRHVIPAYAELVREHPLLELEVTEGEPDEVLAMLDNDEADLGFIYDYTLVPRTVRHRKTLITSPHMVLAVPDGAPVPDRIDSAAQLLALRDHYWIGNSRDASDDELSARLAALAGFTPRIRHRVDSLELVVDLILAGQGVSVLVSDSSEVARVRTVALDFAPTDRRMWAVTRAGTHDWPAAAAVLDHVIRRATRPALD